jgi:DNA-directed RNA polymerase subunit F
MTSTTISESNAALANSITTGIAGELSNQTSRMVKQLETMSAANNDAMVKMAESVSDTKNIDRLITNQKDIVKLLGQLSVQNNEIQQLFQQRDNRVSYP